MRIKSDVKFYYHYEGEYLKNIAIYVLACPCMIEKHIARDCILKILVPQLEHSF